MEDNNNNIGSVTPEKVQQPIVNQNLQNSSTISPIHQNKRQIFFSWPFYIYLAIIVFIFGFLVFPAIGITIFPTMLESIIDYQKEPGLQNVFESLHMPADFHVISSIYGHHGNEGHTLYLSKRYKVHGTREEILLELEPIFEKSGFNLTEGVHMFGINANEIYASNHSNNIYIIVLLFPQIDPSTDITQGSPQKEVSEVELQISY